MQFLIILHSVEGRTLYCLHFSEGGKALWATCPLWPLAIASLGLECSVFSRSLGVNIKFGTGIALVINT